MTAYASNTTAEEIAARIRAANRIAIVTHGKPDGDAMGSALALHRGLAGMGKRPEILLTGPIDEALRTIAEPTPFLEVDENGSPLPVDEFELILVVDTGAWTQLEVLEDWLRKQHDRVIGFDHHSRGDDVASARLVDSGAAATTEMLAGFLDVLGVEITGGRGGIAEALFLGLATDTGWFRFESAGAGAFALASRLLDAGVDKVWLHELIEETHEPARLALEARALASLEYAQDGRVALQSLLPSDFAETGGRPEHLTGIVNAPMVVGAVRVSVLLAEVDPGRTKISFRSKPAIGVHRFTDVNEVAARLGGGGHVCAAGARVAGPLAEATARVLEALCSYSSASPGASEA